MRLHSSSDLIYSNALVLNCSRFSVMAFMALLLGALRRLVYVVGDDTDWHTEGSKYSYVVITEENCEFYCYERRGSARESF